MELLQLRYFAAAAKYQNITKAAREFLIPQPAMSKTISNLEKELGMPLFQRGGNRVVLNENGEQFYATVRQMLKSLDDGVASLKERDGSMSGEIKLLILQNRNAVIDLIAGFTDLHPNVRFTIYHTSVVPEDFEFDFCLASDNFYAQNVQRTLLFTEDIVLAVERSHPLAAGASASVDDLREERFISMPESSDLSSTALRACKRHGFAPKNVILCDDPFSVRKYVSLGMGVAFAPAVAWDQLWPENVRLLPIRDAAFRRSAYLYSKNGKHAVDERLVFKEYLLKHLGSL